MNDAGDAPVDPELTTPAAADDAAVDDAAAENAAAGPVAAPPTETAPVAAPTVAPVAPEAPPMAAAPPPKPPSAPPPPQYPTTPQLPPAGPVHVGTGQFPVALWLFVIALVVGGGLAIWQMPKPLPPLDHALSATVADLSPVHAGVHVGGEEVRELRRLGIGDVVETDAGGRARVRLDAGPSLVLDGGTKLTLTEKGLRLDSGRAFLLPGSSAPIEVDLGKGTLRAVGAAVGIDLRKGVKAYVASGEITATAGAKSVPVRTGETVTLDDGAVVAPERGYDDWTGGLAAPWAAEGPPRRAVGEIWGRAQPGDAGSPLTIRTHEVRATVYGEVAETRIRTTFFNAGEGAVMGDYRVGLPPRALVSGFAVQRGDRRTSGHVMLADRKTFAAFESASASGNDAWLEWAGEGWLRGTVPQILPGQAVTVELAYVEWLPVRTKGAGYVAEYRYPLVGDGDPPLIGEFFASIDAGPAKAVAVAAGMGAKASGTVVELRKADFKPTADFVVDVEVASPLAPARAFVAEPLVAGEESTIVVRTEVPRLSGTPEEGVTLAIVVDASASVDPALLDASRAFVEALVGALGPKDRVVVLSADSDVRGVGPDAVGPADDARKKAILDGLASLSPGGATDLGRALEAAADRLPADAPSGMVVYVGDGWPTIGDRTAEAMKARLARRDRGVPRLGAVLVGPSANERAFAALTHGTGPLVEVGDTEDAARASVDLLEHALVPTVTGVTIDLGPDVARVYPREEIAVPQGGTVMAVGKLAGPAPKTISLHYRQGKEAKVDRREVAVGVTNHVEDLRRRWAEARVISLALAGRGREAITDAALGAGLLTPWTAWGTSNAAVYQPWPLESRVLDLAAQGDAGMASALAGEARIAVLASDDDVVLPDSGVDVDVALVFAARRTVEEARGQLRACRDSRAALRPDLPGAIQIRFSLDGEAKVTDALVTGAGDDALARCVATVVSSLSYPRLGIDKKVEVTVNLVWPPIETLRGKKCSPTSTLAVPLRRGVWKERIDRTGPVPAFLEARRGCELASWTAKRAMLELVIGANPNAFSVLEAALQLESSGDLESAAFLRKEALRRATPDQLRSVRRQLLSTERMPLAAFTDKYQKATDDKARLAVVRTYLTVAPHDPRLRTLLVQLLASLGEKDALSDEVRRLRVDPFADAVLLADAAHALHVAGLDDEAKRTYGEIAERASGDPWAQALLGDRLRGEGWYDAATAAYEALLELVPQDGIGGIRLALAHAGAGRLDVAMRTLARVARTGGRLGRGDVALLAERVAAVLVRRALGSSDVGEADRRLLVGERAELGAPPAGRTFVVFTPPGHTAISAWLERGPDKAREIVPPEATAGRMGVLTLHAEPGPEGAVLLSLGRDKALGSGEPFKVHVDTFEGDVVVGTDVELPASGDRLEVTFSNGAFEVKAKKPAAPKP
jgi:tetratricopeptide (TPR) repeat protein